MTKEGAAKAAPFLFQPAIRPIPSRPRFSSSCSNSGYAVQTLAAGASDRRDGLNPVVALDSERAPTRRHVLQTEPNIKTRTLIAGPNALRLGAGNQLAGCHRGHPGGIRSQEWRRLAEFECDLLWFMDRRPSLLVHGWQTHRRSGSVGARANSAIQSTPSILMFAFLALPAFDHAGSGVSFGQLRSARHRSGRAALDRGHFDRANLSRRSGDQVSTEART